MDHRARILQHLRRDVDALAGRTTAAVLAEAEGFGPVRDEQLEAEVRALAQQGIGLLVEVMTRAGPPSAEELHFIRTRAVLRARQLVPLSALVHAFLIANRTVGQAIATEAGSSAPANRAALALTALAFEYTLLTTKVMADAYLETVQGDLADLERQRGELLAALLAPGAVQTGDLRRRAQGLGLEPGRVHTVVVATVSAPSGQSAAEPSQRWAAEAIGRAARQPDRQAFVVIRGAEVVALLPHARSGPVEQVLKLAAGVLRESRGETLLAGIGPALADVSELRFSYEEARRALRHANAARPFIVGPDGVGLFDELAVSAGSAVSGLIPQPTRLVLRDPDLRASIEAFADANLNVAAAAQALFIHPNTLRYRLRRIAQRTGRDPHVLADLMELTAAARVLAVQESPQPVR